ncbi:MAG: hypothetical protein FJ319_01940 [SAR202 cluster bacterium]|nr:hypothetical protein [SAR202 cluster bacterium]
MTGSAAAQSPPNSPQPAVGQNTIQGQTITLAPLETTADQAESSIRPVSSTVSPSDETASARSRWAMFLLGASLAGIGGLSLTLLVFSHRSRK